MWVEERGFFFLGLLHFWVVGGIGRSRETSELEDN